DLGEELRSADALDRLAADPADLGVEVGAARLRDRLTSDLPDPGVELLAVLRPDCLAAAPPRLLERHLPSPRAARHVASSRAFEPRAGRLHNPCRRHKPDGAGALARGLLAVGRRDRS